MDQPLLDTASLALLATLASPLESGGFDVLGWRAVDLPMLLCIPVLLALSGFFSGSETALFSLSETDRMVFRQQRPLAARAVDLLLADQRMLLITILLGNMTVNVIYFVVSTVLMSRSSTGAVGQAAMAVGFLLLIVLVGEVGPKMIASATRDRFAGLTAPLLVAFHGLITPLRVGLSSLVVLPLARLTAPSQAPPELDDAELHALLEVSGARGEIDEGEQRMLRDVVGMRRLLVRDVMTPRVRMVALPRTATRPDVQALTRRHRLTKIPLYDGDLDHLVGILHVKRFLLDPASSVVAGSAAVVAPRYVPEVATLEQLLALFRRTGTQSAIVVDEYGGTEGVVAVEDVVEELVGDIVGADEAMLTEPRLVGLGQWSVSGAMATAALADAFRIDLPPTGMASVGALVAERLGRPPEVGDRVSLGRVDIEVREVHRRRVSSVMVTERRTEDEPS